MVANLSLALLTWRRALAVKTGGEAVVRDGSASPATWRKDDVLDKDYLIRPSVVPTEKRKISRISSLTKQQLAEESQGARKILQRIHIGSNGGGGGTGWILLDLHLSILLSSHMWLSCSDPVPSDCLSREAAGLMVVNKAVKPLDSLIMW